MLTEKRQIPQITQRLKLGGFNPNMVYKIFILLSILAHKIGGLRILPMEPFVLNAPFHQFKKHQGETDLYQCNFIPSRYKVRCSHIGSAEMELNLSKMLFIKTYGLRSHFSDAEKELITVGDLTWTRIQRHFIFNYEDKEVKLTESQWFGIHAKYLRSTNQPNLSEKLNTQFYEEFEKKAILRGMAKCEFVSHDNISGYECWFPWMKEQYLNPSQFAIIFAKDTQKNSQWEANHFCGTRQNDISHFFDREFKLWKCWNNFVWPYDHDMEVGVTPLSVKDFEAQHGKFEKILKRQPDQELSHCQYLVPDSKILRKKVYLCDEAQSFRKPFWPPYLGEKTIEWKWAHQMHHHVHPPGIGTISYKVYSDDFSFKEYSPEQFELLMDESSTQSDI